jgi:cysteine dioxygenase
MATATRYSPALGKLIETLTTYRTQIPIEELRRHMELTPVVLEDIQPYLHFSDEKYARNPIFRNEVFEMLCLCWKSGQRSPIHDHKGSNCCVRILEGTITATDFEVVPSGYIKAIRSTDLRPYTVTGLESADIHQMSNLQTEGRNVATLHVYTYPQATINVYSLVDNRIAQLTFPNPLRP